MFVTGDLPGATDTLQVNSGLMNFELQAVVTNLNAFMTTDLVTCLVC